MAMHRVFNIDHFLMVGIKIFMIVCIMERGWREIVKQKLQNSILKFYLLAQSNFIRKTLNGLVDCTEKLKF